LYLEKAKPIVRWGRKATGLNVKIAGLPGTMRVFRLRHPWPVIASGRAAPTCYSSHSLVFLSPVPSLNIFSLFHVETFPKKPTVGFRGCLAPGSSSESSEEMPWFVGNARGAAVHQNSRSLALGR
jgi:hypothetical protein